MQLDDQFPTACVPRYWFLFCSRLPTQEGDARHTIAPVAAVDQGTGRYSKVSHRLPPCVVVVTTTLHRPALRTYAPDLVVLPGGTMLKTGAAASQPTLLLFRLSVLLASLFVSCCGVCLGPAYYFYDT